LEKQHAPQPKQPGKISSGIDRLSACGTPANPEAAIAQGGHGIGPEPLGRKTSQKMKIAPRACRFRGARIVVITEPGPT